MNELPSRVEAVPLVETFSTPCRRGRVIGSHSPAGMPRLGCDAERQIEIDRKGLRFRPLVRPGWGRQGLAYGPFRRADGLTLAVAITNGHNTSHATAMPEKLWKRLARWARGANEAHPLARGLAWLLAPRKAEMLRRIRQWARISPRAFDGRELHENLAIGWFDSSAPTDPLRQGRCIVMHAAEGHNGELWARVAGGRVTAFDRIKNVRAHYFVTLRERGAIYYCSAREGAHGFAAYPMMQPIAVDPWGDEDGLFAGIHQSVLGQVGWRVDSIVHGVRILQVPDLGASGSASVWDPLIGSGPLVGGEDLAGWRSLEGNVHLTRRGAESRSGESVVVTEVRLAPGLIHCLLGVDNEAASVGLVWRFRDSGNYWLLKLSAAGCRVVCLVDGAVLPLAQDAEHRLLPGTSHSVQILDAHNEVSVHLDGERLFGTRLGDRGEAAASGLGLWFGQEGGAWISALEAHPREVPIPPEIRLAPPWTRAGDAVEAADDFAGQPGDLAGRRPARGGGEWQRTFGTGTFDVADGEVRIRGSTETPHPNRTFYTLPWTHPDFADVEVTVVPAGCRRGEGHRPRAGLVFWQDARNHLCLSTWLADQYTGASISVFPKRHGFEELYDAVWTMVGDKVRWGHPFRLRCAFDGDDFTIFVDGEPIMERSLSDIYPADAPLAIRRVGLATNWEWGSDTGSCFRDFVARR